MPRMDGTGPLGYGPGTGGGFGHCGKHAFSRRGYRYEADAKETGGEALAAELALLRKQTADMASRLDALNARLDEKTEQD